MTLTFSEIQDNQAVAYDPEGGWELPPASGPANGGVYRRTLKRAFDIAAVIITLPFVVPVTLVLALIVCFDGRSRFVQNPFYVQDRIGMGGRTFRLWKLRSMVVDAERRLDDYLAANPAARIEWDETQKLKNDPRITSLGRLLRKTSLDELPQLWNVFLGDMSLVGPRPMMPDQRDLYPGRAYYTAYCTLRPGLTGLWQISERNRTSFADRSKFDNDYAECLSLVTDISVLLQTVRTVLRGTGY